MDWFPVAVLAVALVAGATASVVGFGIGSLLTPLLALQYGTSAAITALALPHAVATGLRCWRLRGTIDRVVLVRFGMLSAAGGLLGAYLYTRLQSGALTAVLGALLVATALSHLAGIAARWRPQGGIVALLGFGSGFFGGIAGNQGGLRAVALTTFGLTPAAFVATSTAIGVLVDAARLPIYLWNGSGDMLRMWPVIGVCLVGVVTGTLAGERLLLGLTPRRFSQAVAVAVGLLGVWMLVRAA